MSNSNTDQQAPTGRPAIESDPHRERNSVCEGLRASIKRLQSELAEREAEARPMPSSVMRAYQTLIDRHLCALAAKEQQSVEISSS